MGSEPALRAVGEETGMIEIDQVRLRRDLAAATKKLGGLRARIRKKAMRKAVNDGTVILRTEARNLAPKQNGYLKRSLTNKIKTYPDTVVGMVGQDLRKLRRGGTKSKRNNRGGGISGRGDTVPSHLVESKTKSHVISGAILRFQTGRRAFQFARRVLHPGTSGANFLARAQVRKRAAAQRKFETRLIAEADL